MGKGAWWADSCNSCQARPGRVPCFIMHNSQGVQACCFLLEPKAISLSQQEGALEGKKVPLSFFPNQGGEAQPSQSLHPDLVESYPLLTHRHCLMQQLDSKVLTLGYNKGQVMLMS